MVKGGLEEAREAVRDALAHLGAWEAGALTIDVDPVSLM